MRHKILYLRFYVVKYFIELITNIIVKIPIRTSLCNLKKFNNKYKTSKKSIEINNISIFTDLTLLEQLFWNKIFRTFLLEKLYLTPNYLTNRWIYLMAC